MTSSTYSLFRAPGRRDVPTPRPLKPRSPSLSAVVVAALDADSTRPIVGSIPPGDFDIPLDRIRRATGRTVRRSFLLLSPSVRPVRPRQLRRRSRGRRPAYRKCSAVGATETRAASVQICCARWRTGKRSNGRRSGAGS
jgi:hypothetical protein